MGGEFGNETYIDVIRVSSALSPPNFTRSGTTIFIRFLCGKVDVFEFSRISRRDRVGGEKTNIIFHIYVYSACAVVVSGSVHTIFKS